MARLSVAGMHGLYVRKCILSSKVAGFEGKLSMLLITERFERRSGTAPEKVTNHLKCKDLRISGEIRLELGGA
jgi:hypothetical protein